MEDGRQRAWATCVQAERPIESAAEPRERVCSHRPPQADGATERSGGARSAAANEFAAAYHSECRPKEPYGALKIAARCARSAAADESAAAYQSECAPKGRYGALKMVGE